MGNKQLNSCALCVKYLMFVMNFLFFAIGCAIVGLGIWILLERNYMSALVGSTLMTAAAWVIIIAGGFVVIVSLFGCIGSIIENKCMIVFYFTVVLVIFITLVTGGILALVFRSHIDEEVKSVMRESLQDYYGWNLDDSYHRAVTDAWDNAQEKLYCCSVEDQSWNTYRASEWYKLQPGVRDATKPYVPESCCVRDQYGAIRDVEKCQTFTQGPPGQQTGNTNEALHYRGCYSAGKDFIEEYTGYLAGMGIGIGLLMIFGMAFAVILFQQLRY